MNVTKNPRYKKRAAADLWDKVMEINANHFLGCFMCSTVIQGWDSTRNG
ncbi:MAG: hypothetical protein IJ740_03420 [Ruminococcus sp.]|nr:hypothetical protein [Ruminococcus sp.]